MKAFLNALKPIGIAAAAAAASIALHTYAPAACGQPDHAIGAAALSGSIAAIAHQLGNHYPS